MFRSLIDLIFESDWAYAVVFGLAALDAVFPVLPSETAVITAAALAASGKLSLGLVFLSASAGAFVGDNLAYWIGRLSSQTVRRLTRSPRAQRGMQWAERALAERGATVIIVSRFVPGGRTGTMLTLGITHFRWPRFAAFDLLAALAWAGYGCALGALGGIAFADRPLLAVGVALGLGFGLTAAIEGGRWLLRRRSERNRRRLSS
jgi:membrane protein DedA with SNARE-associated domain